MMPFGESAFFEPGREPIALFDRRTGKPVRPVLVDANTGHAMDARTLYAGPGPGFPAPEAFRRERFTEYYERQRKQPLIEDI